MSRYEKTMAGCKTPPYENQRQKAKGDALNL